MNKIAFGLIIYLLIGVLLILWDFRRVIFNALIGLKTRLIGGNPFLDSLHQGQRRRSAMLESPYYVNHFSIAPALVFVILWPVKLYFKVFRRRRRF